ncbi:MAG: sulfatase [Candidatus Fermentibacteraceae bacterium]
MFRHKVLLWLILSLLISCEGRQRPSVLLVILDTVAAGHVGYCGYERNTTPTLDSLAAVGAAFTACQAASPWTLPSGASILTGLYPRSHGARRYDTGRVLGADPAMPTIPSVMKNAGYATAGFVNNYLLGEEFGWHVGYESFYSEYIGLYNAGPTVDTCLAWMDDLQEGEEFFVMVHFFDAHDPYDPPAPFDTLFGPGGPPFNWNTRRTREPPNPALTSHLIDMYDGGVAHVDNELGRLLAGMRQRGLTRNTVVIVVADHGEEFLERGAIWHGKTLNQEALHVPMVFSGAGILPGVYSDPASHVDIVPTLAELTGLDWPGPLEGVDLFHDNTVQPVFSSNLNAGPLWPVAVLYGSDLAIWETTTDTWTAYDLDSDPGRTLPLQPDSSAIEYALLYWASPVLYDPLQVDRDRVDSILEDLGYF